MRILTLSNLYPNPAQPRKGVFVRERLRHVTTGGDVEATVIAPVRWFPFRHPAFGQYATFARVPRESDNAGRRVWHPRYALLPRLGAAFAPRSYAAAVRRTLKRERLGPFDLIDAHFLFPDGATLVVVGQGPEDAALRRLARERGVEGRVRFVPEIMQEQLVDQYNAADVLVLASSSEGMPNVVLESMACGTPVVATAVGGAVEVLEGSETGVLVSERTPGAFAEAIGAVLGRDVDAESVAAEVAAFDWSTTARGLRTLFAELAGDGARKPH